MTETTNEQQENRRWFEAADNDRQSPVDLMDVRRMVPPLIHAINAMVQVTREEREEDVYDGVAAGNA